MTHGLTDVLIVNKYTTTHCTFPHTKFAPVAVHQGAQESRPRLRDVDGDDGTDWAAAGGTKTWRTGMTRSSADAAAAAWAAAASAFVWDPAAASGELGEEHEERRTDRGS